MMSEEFVILLNHDDLCDAVHCLSHQISTF